MTPIRVVVFLLTFLALAVGAVAETLLVPSEYTTIQSAIDAAVDGDEIIVSAGVYEEQLVITRNITLTGAGIDQTVLLAPVHMEHTSHTQDYNAVIHVEVPATAVHLRDFTVDGSGRGRIHTIFLGILFDEVGGAAERIHITNIHETPVSTGFSGIGFYSYSDIEEQLNLLVSDLEITNFQKTGYACFGDGCFQDIRNTVVDASNLHTDAVQNGFELQNTTSGSLTNCTARLIYYDVDPESSFTSIGFIFYFADTWTIEGCVADRCQTGLYGILTTLDAQDVTVIGYPGELNFNYGIVARVLGGSQALSDPATAVMDKAAQEIAQPRLLTESESALLTTLDKTVTMENCTVVGDKIDGSFGMISFSGLDGINLEMDNCTVAGWDTGILSTESDNGWVNASARNCWFLDNSIAGIWANTVLPFDARGNNWGFPSGPFHPSTNPSGEGDEVVANVLFDPWLTGNLVCGPLPIYISQANADENGYSQELVVRYLGGDAGSVYGYSIELTWDPAYLTATTDDVSRPDNGRFETATLFQATPISGGLRVDGALGGGEAGIASGALFKVRFHLVGEPDYVEIPITVHVRHLRDNENQAILDYIPNDGLVFGDVQAPQVESLKVINSTLAHTDDFAKNGDMLAINAVILEGDPRFGLDSVVGDFVYMLGGVGIMLDPDSYSLGEFSWWDRPAVLVPADGPVQYTVFMVDPAGNSRAVTGSITADNTPPQAISGLEATGGHNEVALEWDDPTNLDLNLRHIAINSHQTNDYPWYQAPDPDYPADPNDGEVVFTGLGTQTSTSFPADGSMRDVIYYQAFAVDQVNLVSVAVPGSRDRSTNYLLADVTGGVGGVYDGFTDIYDVTLLGDTFGLPPLDPNYNAECDVGPTDDATIEGVPEPDGLIDLDDLMIFSMAFTRDLALDVPQPTPGLGPDLVWRQAADHVWVLELGAPCEILKGLHLSADLPVGQTVTVTAGPLLENQAASYFLYAKPVGLDVTFAMLGAGVGLEGSGELLRLETSSTLANIPIRWDARSVNNTRLTRREKLPTPKSLAPSAYALHGNHPNPFNPSTTIVFDLPSPQSVQLEIFGIDGRRVANVLTDQLEAGRQQLNWHGRDDQGRLVAAGLYLYRVQAGPWSATGKLNLVK